MGLTDPIISGLERALWYLIRRQALAGGMTPEVAIWGNSMGATQELLEGCQLLRNIKLSGAVSCPTKTCFFQIDERVRLLSQETPHVPSYRRKRWDYT